MIAVMCPDLNRLFADAPLRVVAEGAPVFRVGDSVSSMLVLRTGQVDLLRHTAAGGRLILQRATAGMLLAEASAWSEVYHCDAVATAPSELSVLPRAAFRARLESEPALASAWAGSLARALQAARMRSEIRSLPRIADRLAAWLEAGNTLPERGRLQDVAAELGVTREAFYRELARRRTASGT